MAADAMTIAAGTRLGPYEIVAPIGAGGMGEVYRARDTRLDRSVAIKILPADFAKNGQLKTRFEREAKTISQLSHPNICTLFDVGENYLVMELLEGETLADRLIKGPLPLEQVLRYGVQIADALDKAHRAGIIHRDLKPGNIMLTKSGAKLLDFGLAKTSAPVDLQGATQHKPLTQEGTILGTFQYMAPEQLEGLEADARTDIFAFGTVLYEMATGHRAFEGKTKTSLIAAIVKENPRPMAELQPLTPPALEHVVSKCLSKDPDDRWQNAHDIAEELKWISEAGSSAGVAAPLIARRRSRERLGWVAAVAVAGAAAVFFATRRPDRPPRVETAVVPPEGVAFSYVGGSIALSDDGRQVAFVGRGADGKSLIWMRSLGSSVARPLAGTEGASFPFWSPDTKYIAFAAADKLKKVSVTGGSPETLADAPRFLGGSWNRQGEILMSTGPGIQRVPAAGGKVDVIIAATNRVLSSPRFLPDGRRFLFTSLRGSSQTDGLHLALLDKPEEKMVLPGVYSNAAYAPPGFILYSRDGDLRAQRVDPKTLKAESDPIRLADRVQYDPDSKAALFAVSDTGSLLYLEGEGAGKSELAWVSHDGKTLGTIAPPAMFYSPRLSHDEKRVAVDLSDLQTASGDVWMFDLVHGVSTRLTYDPANESAPIWSPDDRRIFFFSEKRGHLDLYDRPSSGTGAEELLLADATVKIPFDVSPDGQLLAYMVFDPAKKNADVWLMQLATRIATPLLATPFNEGALEFSPDGKWIVYSSDESGRSEIYVQQFPDSTGKWIVSRGGGTMPAWSADGRQIYYISPERKMMSVPVSLGTLFDAGMPVALFDAHVRQISAVSVPQRQYTVTRDGSKFLLNRVVGEAGTRPMTLVQNWSSGLERP
jgi:Tol biopolymer transport system component